LRVIEGAARREGALFRALALLGRETLLVYVLHLLLLFGGLLGPAPLGALHGRPGYGGALLVVAAMVPVLLACPARWRRYKTRAPHAAALVLVFLSVWFLGEFLTRPW